MTANPNTQQSVSAVTTGTNADLRVVTDYTNAAAPTSNNRQVIVMGDPVTATGVARVIVGQPNGAEAALCVSMMPHQADLEDIKTLLHDILAELRTANQATNLSLVNDPLSSN